MLVQVLNLVEHHMNIRPYGQGKLLCLQRRLQWVKFSFKLHQNVIVAKYRDHNWKI